MQWSTRLRPELRKGHALRQGPERPVLSRRLHVAVSALHIDRRAHLELSWQRQQQNEQQLQELATASTSPRNSVEVLEVADLQQLETVCTSAAGHLVVLFLYSKTCGVCKEAAQRFEALRKEMLASRARVVLVKHNIMTEFDDMSDISRFHKVRAVPAFLFIDEGAVVRRLSLRDIRRLTGPTRLVQATLEEDFRRLRTTFLEVLLQRAPSARN